MRHGTFVCVALVLILTAMAENLKGDSGTEAANDKIDRLIKQLGDDDFAKREAASKELDAVGEPALAALRKAAASNADPEIQRRAEQAVQAIKARAGKKELAKWEGTWVTEDRVYIKFSGARFSSGTPTYGPASGTITIVEVGDKATFADLVNEEGPLKGGHALAIFRRDGDSLHACWTYATTRPTEFKTEGNNYCFTFKRVKK
jgi:hypothetical protein